MPKKVREIATTYGQPLSADITVGASASMPTPLFTRYRLSTHEYHLMIAAGVFADDERIELMDGELIMMSPIGPKHFACVNRIMRLFYEKLGKRAIISCQGPINLSENSQPQPDVVLLIPRTDDYAAELPCAMDALLAIEVSDTTLEYDREIKLKVYARAGIAETWIVNLVDNWVEVYRDPDANGYRLMRRYAADESFGPLAFADVAIDPKSILA